MGLYLKYLDEEAVEECAALYVGAFAKSAHHENCTVEGAVNYLKSFMQNNRYLGYVLKDDDGVIAMSVGFIKPWIKGEEYYIDKFCVSPLQHGKGVGTYFLKLIKSDLKENKGLGAIMLSADKKLDAFKFYVKNSFKNVEDSRVLYTVF